MSLNRMFTRLALFTLCSTVFLAVHARSNGYYMSRSGYPPQFSSPIEAMQYECDNSYSGYPNDRWLENISYSSLGEGETGLYATSDCYTQYRGGKTWVAGVNAYYQFCQNGWDFPNRCFPNPPQNPDIGPKPGSCDDRYQGNPVDITNGGKLQIESDITPIKATHLQFFRQYNSRLTNEHHQNFFPRWRHNYERRIRKVHDDYYTVTRENGNTYIWHHSSQGWYSQTDIFGSFSVSSRGPAYFPGDGSTEYYSTLGSLNEIEYDDGEILSFNYQPDSSDLSGVISNRGYHLTITYNPDVLGQIESVEGPDGFQVHYGYDALTRLISARYLDNTPDNSSDDPKRIYGYAETGDTSLLASVEDERGITTGQWLYDDQGRVTRNIHAPGKGEHLFEYIAGDTTRVTDPLGKARDYVHKAFNARSEITLIEDPACPECQSERIGYTSEDRIASKTDRMGTVTDYQTNATRSTRTDALGTPDQRRIITEWYANPRRLKSVATEKHRTEYIYENGRLVTQIETDLSPQ